MARQPKYWPSSLRPLGWVTFMKPASLSCLMARSHRRCPRPESQTIVFMSMSMKPLTRVGTPRHRDAWSRWESRVSRTTRQATLAVADWDSRRQVRPPRVVTAAVAAPFVVHHGKSGMGSDIAFRQCRPLGVFRGIFCVRDYSGTERGFGQKQRVTCPGQFRHVTFIIFTGGPLRTRTLNQRIKISLKRPSQKFTRNHKNT